MKQVFIYTFLLILISCSGRDCENQTNLLKQESNQSTIPTRARIPDDSLIYYTYQIKDSMKIESRTNFQALKDFPDTWVGLSKNALGHFIYHRGKGYAEKLTIVNDSLRNGGYGESISWPIRDFKQLSMNKYYFGLGIDTTSSIFARCTIEILGMDTMYAIQSTLVFEPTDKGVLLVGQYSGLYVPAFKQHLFNHIDEPNRNDPRARIHTEEINLEEFKLKRISKPNNQKK